MKVCYEVDLIGMHTRIFSSSWTHQQTGETSRLRWDSCEYCSYSRRCRVRATVISPSSGRRSNSSHRSSLCRMISSRAFFSSLILQDMFDFCLFPTVSSQAFFYSLILLDYIRPSPVPPPSLFKDLSLERTLRSKDRGRRRTQGYVRF